MIAVDFRSERAPHPLLFSHELAARLGSTPVDCLSSDKLRPVFVAFLVGERMVSLSETPKSALLLTLYEGMDHQCGAYFTTERRDDAVALAVDWLQKDPSIEESPTTTALFWRGKRVGDYIYPGNSSNSSWAGIWEASTKRLEASRYPYERWAGWLLHKLRQRAEIVECVLPRFSYGRLSFARSILLRNGPCSDLPSISLKLPPNTPDLVEKNWQDWVPKVTLEFAGWEIKSDGVEESLEVFCEAVLASKFHFCDPLRW